MSEFDAHKAPAARMDAIANGQPNYARRRAIMAVVIVVGALALTVAHKALAEAALAPMRTKSETR